MSDIVNTYRDALQALSKKRKVRFLAVFGSAAGDAFDPETSDVDVLVEFEAMPPVERAEAYFGLLNDLEALFSREVDLIERAALRNPIIRKAVEDTRVVVYDAA